MNSGSSALKKFRHSIGQNWYHVVITTKYRSKAFQWKETRDVALDVFPEVCKAHLIELYRFEVMDDHVHLFVACPPDMP
ncbi:MAG: transposase, partial [Candidatus Woesearchaeota archaeon]